MKPSIPNYDPTYGGLGNRTVLNSQGGQICDRTTDTVAIGRDKNVKADENGFLKYEGI